MKKFILNCSTIGVRWIDLLWILRSYILIELFNYCCSTISVQHCIRKGTSSTRPSFSQILLKLRTAVYKARIGVKLCQNAFQTICNISFFDAEKQFLTIFFAKTFEIKSWTSRFGGAMNFWVLLADLPRKNDPRWNWFQVPTTFCRGVTRPLSIFKLTFGQKCFSVGEAPSDDMMVSRCYVGMMIR